jgi:hypothetical protein
MEIDNTKLDPIPEAAMNECHRICLTPTRNEFWVIDKFLAAAKTWADRIIVADQGSNDGTLELLQKAPGVETIINDSPVYDEAHRQRLLIQCARKIPGKRIFIALDADEALSANVQSSSEWQRLKDAAPGTVLRFRWVNILPGFKEAWVSPDPIPCGFIDDGCEHIGTTIHSRRIPSPKNAPVLDLQDVVVLHFQYTVWDRVVSKHRWYQAWEHLNHPEKGPLQIFRSYNHMYGSWDKSEIQPLRSEWIAGFKQNGADYGSLAAEPVMWWDREVLDLLLKYGPEHFRRVAIWNKNWAAFAKSIGARADQLFDPRSRVEKLIHHILKATQGHRTNWGVRGFERALRLLGW